MSLALGIDVGTSGVRTAVIDTSGQLVSMAMQEHAPQDPNMIRAELWWDTVRTCLKSQISKLRREGHNPRDIARCAVDGTSGTMLFVNGNLEPVTRALMYNSSGFYQEAQCIARVAPDTHIARGPSSALARALRLKSEDTDHQALYLMHQADFITARLIGAGGNSDLNNSLKTGVNPETGEWPTWINDTGLDIALLPRANTVGASLDHVSRQVAQDLGLSGTMIVHAGTTDSIAAFLACATPAPGVAVTSLGTTLVVKVMSTTRVDVPQIGLYSHRLGDAWLAGGASNSGGGVLARYFTHRQLTDLSNRIDPSISTGLNYYPLSVPGERFPTNDPDKQPRLSPHPGNDRDFLHGMLEGMAAIEARCYRTIEDHGGTYPHTLFTAGGGAGNRAWTSIREAAMGVRILTSRHTDAAVGVARVALVH